MKVLHFFKTYFPDTMGGVERVIYQLAEGSAQHGIQAEVLSLTTQKGPRTLQLKNHVAHRARCDFQIASTGFSASSLLRFKQLAEQADVIHYHFPWPFMDLVQLLTGVKKPSVVTYHSDILRQRYWLQLYRPLRHWFLKNADVIIATSPNYLASSDVLKHFASKVKVIPIGLDHAEYPIPSSHRLAYWRNRIGERFFLFVGVLRYYKGLHILLEAARHANYPIVILGAGPIEGELKRTIAQHNLKNVMLLGEQPEEDKAALLQLCYSLVFPSHLRTEAFGLTLLEGAMYGKPLISSEIGTGTTFVNIDKQTGIVVPPSDPAKLASAMRYLWENPEAAAQMGEAAQQRYHQYFTAEKMIKDYAAVYESLVKD